MKPGTTGWSIQGAVEDAGGWIKSPASALCPANQRAGHSDRLGQKGWRFADGKGGWVAGDITVNCSSHSYRPAGVLSGQQTGERGWRLGRGVVEEPADNY